jgi:hypothetical protein
VGKRFVLFLALVTALITTALVPGSAGAGPIASEVTIDGTALWSFPGAINVGVRVRCLGGVGAVEVTVNQPFPESTTNATGTGGADVVCDGQAHTAAVLVIGDVGLDVGRAFAQAVLVAPSGPATDARVIRIVIS